MADAMICNLERDGEVRPFAGHGQAVLGTAGGMSLLKAVFEPGWRWSNDVAPIAGTASCQIRHLGYMVAGRMGIRLDEGRELEVGPGDLFDIPAGHDAWVVGTEPCVAFDVSPEATRYARGPMPRVEATPDPAVELVRQGYAAFNAGDFSTLSAILSRDVVHHAPGSSQIAGEYKGIDTVLDYYRKLGELTGGSLRADLIDVHSDGRGHVMALHQASATRNGVTRVARESILFTVLGERIVELLELHADLAGNDAFFA